MKQAALFNYLCASLIDVCFVQEVMLSDPFVFSSIASRWRGPCFWSPAIGRRAGVFIFISESCNASVISWQKDSDGRVLSLLVKIGSFKFNLVNIYAPTVLTDRKIFFDELHEFFLPADFTIIAGDFNCYEKDLDKFGGNISLATYLSDFRSTFHLVDAFRRLHPTSRDFSWFNSDHSIGSRLDKFFVSSNFIPFVQNCSISPCFFSDHDFVDLHFVLNDNFARGPGLWKFNNSLLFDSSFCSFIRDRISDLSLCINSFPSVKTWWDFFKRCLQADIVAFASGKQKQFHHARVTLTNELIACKQRFVQGDSSVVPRIVTLKAQLSSLTSKHLEGVKIRSRAKWLDEGEKPSRFFFKLERERIASKACSSILNSDGVEVFTRPEIEQAHVQFYANLFSPEQIDLDCKQRLLAGFSSFLSDDDCEFCEGIFSLAELTTSVNSLNLGKSPGPDGFTVEFYREFWHLLGPLLLRVALESFADGMLPESMKGSATRLLFKQRGDVKDLKNWRPISLLNVDYKIISKVVTTRLSRVLGSVVFPDQTCSVPDRSISSNVVLLRDVFDYIERTDEAAILISLDQEKAFDRVDRSFLYDLLRHLGFGPNFRKWVFHPV